MDYSQFLHMHAELSLLLVIVVLFFADLFMCPDKKSAAAHSTQPCPSF